MAGSQSEAVGDWHESPTFKDGFDAGRAESEMLCALIRDPKCDRCGARNTAEAETLCRPSDCSCPGVEWPLERIWELATPAAAPERAVAWPAGVLNRDKTLEVLTHHNEWRRGGLGNQTDPVMLGRAIDAAVAALAPTKATR